VSGEHIKDLPGSIKAIDEGTLRQQANHIWHVWLNRRNTAGQFDHSMYEFKSMLQFLAYGHEQIEKAFTGNLRTIHRQCSHSLTEKIPCNKLSCAFGTDVTKCEILVSIKTTFQAERERECGKLGKHYDSVPDSEMYRVMANTCAWHMFTEPLKNGTFLDTSEGWLTDVSDRMFWDRVYSSLAARDPDDEEPKS
jgi:hypothetical protein